MVDIKESIVERFKSPVLGNLIFSWLIINWQIPYVTFFVSEKSIHPYTKIEYIRKILESYDCFYWTVYIFPLIATTFMIVAYPWALRGAEAIIMWSRFWFTRFEERKAKDFVIVKQLNEELIKFQEKINSDFRYRVLKQTYKLDDVFMGNWKIQFAHSGKEFLQCKLRNHAFINSNSIIITFVSDFIIEDTSSIPENISASITCRLQDSEENIDFYVQFLSRDNIILTSKILRNFIIRLRWIDGYTNEVY